MLPMEMVGAHVAVVVEEGAGRSEEFRHSFKAELTGFADGLDMGWEEKRKVPMTWRIELSLTERGNPGGASVLEGKQL